VKEYPYWWDTVDSSPRRSAEREGGPAVASTEVPHKADVVIVGAGYTGLSAARRLAFAGASVVVVERERAGWGASSRNGGQVLTGLKLDAAALVARYGDARARELFGVATAAIAELDDVIASESIACEYTRSGHLQAAWKASHFDAFVEEQAILARVFNHQVRVVPRGEQRREIGSDRYYGVLVDEGSRALNPAQYVRGLAAAASRAGVAVCEGVRATAIERAGAGWRVSTSNGAVEAGDVLLATNGYTDGVAPELQRRFVPVGSYIIATEPLAPERADALLPHRRVVFDSKNFLYYFRLTSDRRLLFGGRAEFGTPDPSATCRAARILREGMIEVFPQLAAVGIDYAWGGNVAFTRDQMPRAGRLDGVYYAGGYAGHGIAMATHLGSQIARRIAGEPISHPLFDDDFPPIPAYSGTPWFLPLVGAYYQVKDWLQ
jgi:glycine/D-amino acid oxidase-like deaminating enzyme